MLHTPLPGTPFYRVTDRGRTWPDVLSGAGAYFSFGGRYNRVHQKTVYAAEDPLVSIAEYAFHQALDLQRLIGGGPLSAHPPLPQPPLPLVSEHFLWCFTLQNAPPLLDVEHPTALHTFHHGPFEVLNPSAENYHRTAMLADLVRHHPNPHHPAAGGILAPSVRTPSSPGDSPGCPQELSKHHAQPTQFLHGSKGGNPHRRREASAPPRGITLRFRVSPHRFRHGLLQHTATRRQDRPQ
jgi:RES domain